MSNDKKTLADVQPGGRVRLGDQALSTSEGARRYVADYFATQLSRHDFGDYILTELAADFACALAQHLSAQPSPVAYHGDVDLKWLSGSISEVAHRLSTYMPTGLAEWADRARDCRIAAQVLSELSAQPSLGGQGGLNYERMFVDACAALAEVSRELGCDPEQGGAEPILAAIAELREALAARQPVEQEPAFFVNRWEMEHGTAPGLVAMRAGKHLGIRDFFTVPLYAAPPAQAVDLDAVRALLQRRIEQWRSHLPADPGAPGTREIETKGECDYNNDVAIYRQGIAVMEEVLFKIDSQAVGNG